MTERPAQLRWPRAVVFDLDGTLIDSAGDIADILNEALTDAGLPTFDEQSVVPMIGAGARVLVERAMLRLDLAGDRQLTDRLHEQFTRRYAEIGAGRSRVFPGARELLEGLAGAGVGLAICTNKPAAITTRVLEELDLTQWFEAVVGETSALPRKPDPAMLLAALDWLDADPSDAVMVGDSAADIAAARAARVRSIAVTFGYTTIPAAELGADALVDGLSDVPAALAHLASR